MLDWLARRMEVSTTVAALLLVLIVVQLATQIYALADLARRDRVRGDKKWVWVLIIAFGNLVGAIAYLAIGRNAPPPASDSGAAAAGSDAARRAVDALYGPPDQR